MTIAAQNVVPFNIWRAGYDGKFVSVFAGSTTTLARLFSDIGLTVPAPNPVTLLSQTIDGTSYGKFPTPLYVAGAYSLMVDGSSRSGVALAPITDMKDEDVSLAVAKSSSGSVLRRLTDRFDDFVYVLDQGQIGVSPQTNSDTITAAIGKVAALGGGDVLLPSGTTVFTTLQLTTGVHLRGHGRGATTLQSVIADKAITINGPRCGLQSLTLDGVSLQAGSVGVYSLDNDQIFMMDAEIKRFDKGFWAQGMQLAAFREFHVNGCNTNVLLGGDKNAAGIIGRGLVQNNRWLGGIIGTATAIGLDMEYVDSELLSNLFDGVKFDSNLSAVKIVGARFTEFPHCAWTGNATDLDVSDSPLTAGFPRDYVQGITISGTMNGGAVNLTNTDFDIVIKDCDIKGVAFNLTLPTYQLLLQNCVEDAAVTITGDGTKLVRSTSFMHGETDGRTIGSTPVVAWRRTLGHGEVVAITVRAVGQCATTDDRCAFTIHGSAYRPAASLAYKTQSANFGISAVVTGATSHASATIVADADAGATGTLKVINLQGTFLANEVITDTLGGSAIVSGGLVANNVAIGGETITATFTSAATCACHIVADVGDLEVQVTGIVGATYNFTVGIDLTSSN
jgi:hypothetical protein